MPNRRSVGKVGHSTSQFRVTNWPLYAAELCRRGSVTLSATRRVWRAIPRKTRGGQECYSSAVIETMVLLRRIFHLTLRETESLMTAIMALLDLDLPVPDHSTMSRRGAAISSHNTQIPDGPLHIRLDENGLKVCGRDELLSCVAPGKDMDLHHLKITIDPLREAILVTRRNAGATVDAFLKKAYSDQHAEEIRSVVVGRNAVGLVADQPPHIDKIVREPNTVICDDASPSGLNENSRSDQQPNRAEGDRSLLPREAPNSRAGKDLVQTWLQPPVRGGRLVDRRRLTGLMEEVSKNTLTFVKAPAGYGKSTVLAQWYEALLINRAAVGWFSANHTEYHLGKFFRYAVAAIQTSRPQFGGKIDRMLNATDDFSAESISSVFVNEILDVKESVYLFIDDFHLISDPKSSKAVAIILSQPPANLHLIIASRQTLPFDVSRLRMRGLLAEIGVDWLRFDPDEAASFLSLAGHALSPSEIQTVVNKTEGWAAGIQLASISMAQRKSRFFSLISGEHTEIATFLAEDVLSHLPASTVEFMEKTAILSRMNPALCTALTGFPDARAQIDVLDRQSLFLFSLDEKRQWYRYHHLFADFLQRRLRNRDPGLFADLHRKAGDWFAERDLFEEGVAHAIQAGDHVRAASILEKGCADFLYAGRPSMLVQWSKSIPDSVLQEFPRLQLEIAWSIILEWNFKDARRILLDAERKTEELGAKRGQAWLDHMRKIIMHRKSMLYLFTDEMKSVESEIEKGIPTFPEDDPYLRGNLDTNLLYARRELYRLDDVNKIDSRARQYYDKAGRDFVLVWHESIAGPTWFLKGETQRAERSLRTAMEIAEAIEGPVSALKAMPALLLAEVLYEQNRCDEAADLIAQYGGQAEKKGFVDHLAAYYTVKASLEFRAGDVDTARATLDIGRASAERHGFDRLRRRVGQEEMRQDVLQSLLSKASRFYGKLVDGARLTPRTGTSSGDETEVLTWARACWALGDGAKAASVLKQWIVFCRNRGAVRSEVRLLIALAICLRVSGKEKEAARRMREAVTRAAGPGFVRCFLDEGTVVETLLRSLFSSRSEVNDPVGSFGRKLLDSLEREPNYVAQPNVIEVEVLDEEDSLAPPESLNAREREILNLVSLGLSNKEIAHRLSLAEASVKWHLQQVFTKLDVRRRIGAVRRAQKLGLL
jgi:LuxR family transcriptional regulator, maltose regulon positive regulatory protein